jgi:hypothetical protein
MVDLFVTYFIDFKLEIYAGVALTALYFLKRQYQNNEMLAGFIRFTTERIAAAMEADPGVPEVSAEAPTSKKAALRRKVRRELAARARKSNRGAK